MTPLPRRPIALLLAALLVGFASGAGAQETPVDSTTPASTEEKPAPPVDTGLTGQVLYQYLLAEIAAARGQLTLSANIYADLARSTRDVRIARRAAELAFYSQQPGLALETTKLWAELDPDSVQARQALWNLLAASDRYDELAAALAKALAQEGPATGNALLLVNRMFVRVQDKVAVRKLIDQVTEPYLNLPEAHFTRAQAAVAASDNAAAVADLDRALAIKPDWEPALLSKVQLQGGNPAQSLAVLDDFLARNKQNGQDYNETRLVRARLLVELKRYPEARAAFGELLARQPDNPELIYATGLLSLQLGNREDGEKLLKPLLERDFNDKDGIRLYLGQAAEDKGKPEEALAYYDNVSPDHNRYGAAQTRAAAILHGLGRDDEALEHLDRALAAGPKEKLPLLLAQAQLLSERGRPADAYAVLDGALRDQPDEPVLLYESSILADKIGDYAAMERKLRHLIQLQPDNAAAYNALGYSFTDRNVRLDEAKALLDKAIALSPEDPFIQDSRGWLDFRLGKLPDAEAWLRRAAAQRKDAEFSAHLGEVLWQQGRRDEAVKIWDEAAKLDPRNELLNSTRQRLQP